MNFNFNDAAGITNNPANKSLQPNMIHTVTFDGCEAIDGVEFKNGTKGNVLDIKFANNDGYYTETIFEPKSSDEKRQESEIGGKKYVKPSNIENLT